MSEWFEPALITVFSSLAAFALGFRAGMEYVRRELTKYYKAMYESDNKNDK